jgi:hypothetical protein
MSALRDVGSRVRWTRERREDSLSPMSGIDRLLRSEE